jgi:hypothetical protein
VKIEIAAQERKERKKKADGQEWISAETREAPIQLITGYCDHRNDLICRHVGGLAVRRNINPKGEINPVIGLPVTEFVFTSMTDTVLSLELVT